MSAPIVVGVDGSEGSRLALEWALGEARVRKQPVKVILAWSYLDQPGGDFDPSFGEEDAHRVLDEMVDRVTGDDPDIEIERMAVCELPARALLEACDDAAMVVVGSRGLGGFKSLLLGSVSHQVAQHAPCPIVIVPGAERPGG